jgi:hypothetical protein
MASPKMIIEQIRRLSARDRRVVIKHLEQLDTGPASGRARRSVTPRVRIERPYSALIDLAGMAHSEHTDVSTDKYLHLGSAYAAE